MGIVTKYKFNQTIYSDFIPEFNTEFINYTITDEIDTDGFTIRIIESDSLPTLIRFGNTDASGNGDYTKQYSLLEVNELNTNNVTNMSLMFYQCKNLTYINTNFNTSNVNNMNSMFRNCSSLTSLDVSNFNTENVTIMLQMFQNCSLLTSLDASNFNTENVIDMGSMFYNCSSLISLDVSNFNTKNVTNMSFMFYDCSKLTSLDASNFNTENVTDMNSMFRNCSSLTSLDVSSFNTSQVINIEGMFRDCSSLTSLNVSNFDTSQVTSMSYMFQNCSSLTSLDVSSFDTSKVTSISWMFTDCSSLTSIDVSNFNTSQVTIIDGMFYNCFSLMSLDVSNFNTSKVINIANIFENCSSLTSLDISSFNMKNATSMNNMFQNCYDLTNVGVIYCDADTINKISDLITTDTTIWYSDAKLEDLTEKENITYKEYKMNILESDEEIVLYRVGDSYNQLNLETGELTQRIGEVVFDGSDDETWGFDIAEPWTNGEYYTFYIHIQKEGISNFNETTPQTANNKYPDISYLQGREDGIGCFLYSGKGQAVAFRQKNITTLEDWKTHLQANPITVQYRLATESVKTINLKNKPSINWQGDDIYLHLENNTLYPQLDCEIESINYYEIPKLKANTLYTLRYVGEPTQCILGGLTYRAENNMILTSGSSDNLLHFDKKVRKVVLIEGDVRDRNFDYFEGIESLGAVEIVVHKSDMPIFAKGGRK